MFLQEWVFFTLAEMNLLNVGLKRDKFQMEESRFCSKMVVIMKETGSIIEDKELASATTQTEKFTMDSGLATNGSGEER